MLSPDFSLRAAVVRSISKLGELPTSETETSRPDHDTRYRDGFTKVVNGKEVTDDTCDSCGKVAASVECGHGVLCEKCAAEIHGSVEASCEVTQ
jgi:hypothetical protein